MKSAADYIPQPLIYYALCFIFCLLMWTLSVQIETRFDQKVLLV